MCSTVNRISMLLVLDMCVRLRKSIAQKRLGIALSFLCGKKVETVVQGAINSNYASGSGMKSIIYRRRSVLFN